MHSDLMAHWPTVLWNAKADPEMELVLEDVFPMQKKGIDRAAVERCSLSVLLAKKCWGSTCPCLGKLRLPSFLLCSL